MAKPGLTRDTLTKERTSRPPTKSTTRPNAHLHGDERTHHAGADT